MSRARPEAGLQPQERTPEQEAVVKAAGPWVQQLARTLKNCRLYDGRNPTVMRFKQELSESLERLLDEHGPLRLQFTADDVLCEGASLYAAKSRDDNLALPFFRDGIRSLELRPGTEPREIEALLDAVIRVTGQNEQDDDLVTSIWEAHLLHVSIDYVPGEADIGSGADATDGVPWPTSAGQEAEAQQATASPQQGDPTGRGRSDDWEVGQLTAAVEADFAELESLAPGEVERFKAEYLAESGVSVVPAAVAAVRAYWSSGLDEDEKADLARFLPRVVRLALDQGAWRSASEALDLLRTCGGGEWSGRTHVQELLQPISIAGFRDRLETQEGAQVDDFIAFAERLGESGPELLQQVLAEIQNPRHQRQFIEGITEVCRANPELLAPFLTDRRWLVVRNTLHVLGAIGGAPVAGLLEAAAQHQDPRIRQELVAALRSVPPEVARPLLLRLLEGADTRMFCSVLGVLSQQRHPIAAQAILVSLLEPGFAHRPVEERRAIYRALSATGGDEVLPELEAELLKGGWFSHGHDADRPDVARCIARIGTPMARTVLERGAASRRGSVRKACEAALARFDRHE